MRYGLALDGWSSLSTWGWDEQTGTWFADLTRDGGDDSDRPDVWLSGVPRPIPDEGALAAAIASATGRPVGEVRTAMHTGRQ